MGQINRHGGWLEAEQAARDLLVLFPDVHDGYDRLGRVYKSRGENRQAAECYRKVITFNQGAPRRLRPRLRGRFVKLVEMV